MLRDRGRRSITGCVGIAPIPAVQKLFNKTGLSMKDIDLVELNEAFASQGIYVQRTLEIPNEKLNVNGGAIALGHPLGCTGAKLVASALYELKRRNGKYAVVTMCIGGGMGAQQASSSSPEAQRVGRRWGRGSHEARVLPDDVGPRHPTPARRCERRAGRTRLHVSVASAVPPVVRRA